MMLMIVGKTICCVVTEMTQKSRYQYEKRIKELQQQVQNLKPYRDVVNDFYNTLCSLNREQKQVSHSYFFEKVKAMGCFK